MIRLTMEPYAFRDILESDLPLLLEWRNSPRIHSKMLTDHKITWEEHLNWYRRIRSDPIKKYFVFTFKAEPVGYVGFGGLNLEARTCYGGSYIGAPDKCPRDAGMYLGFMAGDYAFSKFDIDRIDTEVFADNKRVVKLNELFGCVFDPAKSFYVEKDGERKLVLFGVTTRENWLKRRAELIELLQAR